MVSVCCIFCFKQKTAYEMRISDWSSYVCSSDLSDWQARGLVSDMAIEPGEKTAEPIRTRGWTHWHHLFGPRQLVMLVALRTGRNAISDLLLPRADRKSTRLNSSH